MRSRFAIVALTLAVTIPVFTNAQEVRDRESHQQGRIAQGLRSGQITTHGATNLESRAAAINARRRADLAANGGRLTNGEYRRLNGRENALSHQIYNDKHNDIAQPGVAPR